MPDNSNSIWNTRPVTEFPDLGEYAPGENPEVYETMPYPVPEGESVLPPGWVPGDDLPGWGGGAGGDGTDGSGDFNLPPGPNMAVDGSDIDWGSFDLSNLGEFLGTLGSKFTNVDPSTLLMIPAFTAAYKQWQDAGKYRETAKEAMPYGDPFGKDNRAKYQGMLADTYENPDKWLNDPGHKAKRKSGMEAIERMQASKGYLGSGNMMTALADYVTNLDNQFLSDERKNLKDLTGSQFDPATAGKFLMEGDKNAIDSENSALGNLFLPFLNKAAYNSTNVKTGDTKTESNSGTPKGNNGNGWSDANPSNPGNPNWSKYVTTPAAARAEILRASGGTGGTAAELWAKVLSGQWQDISPSTRAILNDMANDPNAADVPLTHIWSGNDGYDTPPLNPGEVDYPPPGWNPLDGYGGGYGPTPEITTNAPIGEELPNFEPDPFQYTEGFSFGDMTNTPNEDFFVDWPD